MADLQATSSPAQAAAPITSLAHEKLRSLGSSGTPLLQHDGVLDAFAEVFARMAVTQSPKVAVEDQVDADVSSDQNHHQPDTETADGAGETDDVKLDVIEPVVDDSSLTIADANVVAPTEPIDSDGGQSEHEAEVFGLPVANTDEVVAQPVAVQSDVAKTETGSAPIVETPTVGTQDHNERNDRRSDAQQQLNVDGPEIQHRHDQAKDPAGNQVKPEANADGVGLASPISDEPQDDSRRRRRDRRLPRLQNAEGTPALKEPSAKPTSAGRVEFALGQLEGEAAADHRPEPAPATVASSSRRVASAISAAAPQTTSNPVTSSTFSASAGNRVATGSVSGAAEVAGAGKGDGKANSKTSKSADNRASEAVNRAKLIQRVSKAFQHLGPEGGVVRLRLAPAELGTVRVEMRIAGRQLNARVVAETEAASSILREHLTDLRQRLESFGMQVERIDIETEGNESHLDGRFSNQHPDQQHRRQDRSHHQPFGGDRETVSQSVSPQEKTEDRIGTTVGSGVDLRL